MRRPTVARTPRRLRLLAAALEGAALLGACLGSVAQAAPAAALPAGTLPVAASKWLSSGQATAARSGNTLTINQTSNQAVLNWQSFNIARGSAVNFVQPGSSAQVLNRIADASPSLIQGALQANGRVYLVNQNGIVFGQGAQMNVAGLVASSLDITDDVFLSGALSAGARGLPAFSGTAGFVQIESGAAINTVSGGQVWILAPSIENSGVINTPDGQTLLAAGKTVYLSASEDAAMRGVKVEVGSGGSVVNLGQIVAERGNITLAGLAVNQSGRLTATTTVSRNGSIWLQAVERPDVTTNQAAPGSLTLAGSSVTEVLPETASTETSTDAQTFLKSQVQLSGHLIDMQGGALIHAASGEVNFDSTAATNSTTGGRIYLGSGATVDVAGLADVSLPMSRNFLQVRLTSNELADSALQKSGFLLGKTVTVDVREGTSLADVSAAMAQIGRKVDERSTTGGTITMTSGGDVVLLSGSTLDVSGGSIHYDAGWGSATQLVSADGRIVDIGRASADQVYTGFADQTTVTHSKWGVTNTFSTRPGHYNPAYLQGQDAGTISITAPAMALDGTLLGRATAGSYQRTASTLAKGGKLVLAQSSDATGYSAALRMAAAASALHSSFDVASSLPAEQAGTLTIDATRLMRGGFTRLDFTSAGDITLDAGVNLNLGVGGSLSLKQSAGYAGNIVIGGSVTAPGGTVSALSVGNASVGDIVLLDGARIDVAGLWTNDNPALGQTTHANVATAGGSVSLQAARSLDLQSGSEIDVSGGAWYSAAGKLSGGKAGSITLAASRGKVGSSNQSDGALLLNGNMLGYGLTQGGTLNLSADGFALGSAATTSFTDTVLPLSFFSTGGFNTFKLTAWDRQSVLQDSLAPVVSNWVLPGSYTLRASSGHLAGVAGTAVLPAVQRQAVNLTLPLSELSTGAAIITDAGGSITVNGGAQLLIDGLIQAPGGSITLNQAGVLPISSSQDDFDSSQVLWLGSHAVLDASGAAVVAPDKYGRRSGSVLAGGSVNLSAAYGFVVTEAGSLIDVSGSTATLDLATSTSNGTFYTPQRVSSSAGSISLSSNTGMLMAGQMRGQAPTSTDQGGTLSITLTPDTNNVLLATRSLLLQTAATDWPSGLLFGQALSPSTGLGQAVVSTSAIAAGGFDVVNLKSWGELRFSGDTTLAAGRSISLSAPNLAGDVGGDVGASLQLIAPYVSLGNADGQRQSAAAAATAGDASLLVQAQTIDLIGTFASQGLGASVLQASGDIRLRGVLDTSTEHNSTNTTASTALVGAYTTSGNLTLQAAQVYPTTLSQYTLKVNDAAKGVTPMFTLRANRASASAAAPLSAGGAVTIHADHIDIAGTLRAPLGSISLNAAGTLTLESGALVSVSGAGLTVPYGYTEAELAWYYALDATVGDTTRLAITEPGSKSIELKAARVDLHSGATVDVSGGGDLLAWEWQKGSGGSTDVLAQSGMYAIVPALGSGVAPSDWQNTQGSTLQVGDSVYLSGIAGLAAGTYTLLPAHYALLPGAYAIKLATGKTDMLAAQNTVLANGSLLVAGRRVVSGTSIADARSSGFVLMSGALVRASSQYVETSANQFFSSNRPADAGVISLIASQAMQLDGSVGLSASSGARGAVSITAPQIEVVSEVLSGPDASATAGWLQLDADTLSGWQVRSLTLSGQAITVANDAQHTLRAQDLSLSASNTLTLAAGSSTAGTDSLSLSAVNIALAESAQVSTPALNVASQQINLGEVPTGAAGLNLSAAQLVQLSADTTSLALRAGSSVNLYGDFTLGGQADGSSYLSTLTLDTPVVQSHGGAAAISAGVLTLQNSGTAASADLAAGAGELTLASGSSLTIGAGSVALPGLQLTTLSAARDVLFTGAGKLSVAGEVHVDAARITASSGAVQALQAGGAIVLAGNSNTSSAVLQTSDGLGAQLGFSGASLISTGLIDLTAGRLTLSAKGDLTLASGSITRVWGVDETFYDTSASAPGGAITLTSTQGSVNIQSGAELNVSGSAGGGNAGSLTINAVAGQLNLSEQARLLGQAQGSTQTRGTSASFALDVNRVASQDAWAALNTVLDGGGFTASRSVRARTGDLRIDAGQIWQANQLSFTADSGSLTVAGELLAAGPTSGSIELWAGAGLTLGSSAHLQATGQGSDAASVVLGNTSATRFTDLQAGARIDVASADAGGTAGNVTVRVARTGVGAGTDVALNAIQSSISGAARVNIEAVQTYSGISSVGTTSGTGRLTEAQVATDTAAFMAHADAVLARLGVASNGTVHLTPGVEVQSSGNLTLGSDWSLYTASRPGGEAGTLTLRAAGNLLINANLSDGFASTASSAALQSGASWSYQLVGGADLSAAKPLSVVTGAGNVQLAASKVVRTGTGSIDVAAGGDVVFGSGTSALYTAGTVAADLPGFTVPTGAVYSEDGGNISVTALGNITGVSASTQDTSYWLYRWGSGAGTSTWWVSFKDFAQNIGALGGGDVSLAAGGNIANVSAAIATNGRLASGASSAVVLGGGDLSVQAGGDIQGGVFAAFSGTGLLSAGGAITAGSLKLAPLIGMGDAQFTVQALGDVTLDGVFNPMLMTPGNQGKQGLNNSYFSSYTDDSRVDVLSLSGDAVLSNNTATALSKFKHSVFGQTSSWLASEAAVYSWYPGSVNVAALRGDVSAKAMTLLPSAQGGLSLLADGSVRVLSTLVESDLNPQLELANVQHPASLFGLVATGVTVSAQSLLHADDADPIRLYARSGDVSGPSQSSLGRFAEPVEIRAGSAITNAGFSAVHYWASDVSVLEAAGDVLFTSPLNASGGLATNNLGVTLAGPGTLEVSAGGHVDLGTSAGLTTIGNLKNASLPSQGARIVVSVGLGRDEQGRLRLPAIEPFMAVYVAGSDVAAAGYRRELVAYLADLGQAGLSETQALQAFGQLSLQQQLPFAAKVLYAELRASGRAQAASGQSAQYQRGYTALATLFPAKDYSGELRLYLSQIKTQRGGDISLLVPGGQVNEGLATPPASLSKTASQLGIVTLKGGSIEALVQDNFMVNQSRVFTLGGGDILIWSSSGNIDAGRGAKSTAYAPAPTLITKADGTVEYDSSAAASGSGIAVLLTDPAITAGSTDLIAPRGTVNAGEAGIRAQGNLYIAALHVIGADNISVQGSSVGVPVVSAPAAGLTALRSDADVASAVQQSLDALQAASGPRGVTPSTFTVEVIGYGP